MRQWLVVGIIGLVVICAAVAVIAITRANDRAALAAQNQAQINRALVQSCEDNGNPLRMAVQQMLRDQIRQSHSPKLEEFFPQIPPRQLHRLIHRANERRRQEIRQIAPVDCASLYQH